MNVRVGELFHLIDQLLLIYGARSHTNLILPERSFERIIVCQLVDVLQRISTTRRDKKDRREERRHGQQQTSKEIMRGLAVNFLKDGHAKGAVRRSENSKAAVPAFVSPN